MRFLTDFCGNGMLQTKLTKDLSVQFWELKLVTKYILVGGKQLDQKTLKMRLDRMTRSTQEQFEVHLI